MWRLFAILILGLGVICTQPHSASANQNAWPRALELLQSGQTKAALPLLEQLVSAFPDNKDYRFELALALHRLGRPFRAKWHLEQVRGTDLTSAEARAVDQLLTTIEAKSVWSGTLGFQLKSETNINRQTRDRTINVNGLDFVLRPDAMAKPGVSLVVNADIGYAPPISDRWSGLFSLSAYIKHNEHSSYRDTHLMGRTGLRYRPNPRIVVEGGLLRGNRWVSDDRYSTTTGLWAAYSQLVGGRGKLNFGMELGWIEAFDTQPDSRRALVQGGYAHAIGGNARLGLVGYVEATTGGLRNLTGQRAGVAVSGLYAWKGGLMTSVELAHHLDRRRGAEPLFGITREDRKTSGELSIYHRDISIGSFAPMLIVGTEANRSNIPLARHDNQYLSIGLTRNF